MFAAIRANRQEVGEAWASELAGAGLVFRLMMFGPVPDSLFRALVGGGRGLERMGDAGDEILQMHLNHGFGLGEVGFADPFADGLQFSAGVGGQIGINRRSFEVGGEQVDIGALQVAPV